MAYHVISKYTRSDTSIKWHTEQTFDETITKSYVAVMFTYFHGKKIRAIFEENPNTLVVEFIWDDIETYNDWAIRHEVVALQSEIKKYNDSVGIVAHPRVKREI